MKSSQHLKTLLILVVAPCLALSFFWLTRDWSRLTASVLDLQELQTIEEHHRGLAYKTNNQQFELFGSTQAQNADRLTFEVIYHPEKVEFKLDQASGFNLLSLTQEEGRILGMLGKTINLPLEEGWFQLPFSGDAEQIVLGEVSFFDGAVEKELSVGNLNPAHDHTLLP